VPLLPILFPFLLYFPLIPFFFFLVSTVIFCSYVFL
jgi:hypothetical protein